MDALLNAHSAGPGWVERPGSKTEDQYDLPNSITSTDEDNILRRVELEIWVGQYYISFGKI